MATYDPHRGEKITQLAFDSGCAVGPDGIPVCAASVGNAPAIIPSIEGWARITGYNTIFIDERDPYAHGFQVV